MKTLSLSVALLAAGALLAAPAFAQQPQSPPKADCAKKAPEKIDGEVTKIDKKNGLITVRGNDGTTHEFKGSKETLADYKVGDKLEAKLRQQPNC